MKGGKGERSDKMATDIRGHFSSGKETLRSREVKEENQKVTFLNQ